MKKNISINISGIIFHIEEDGFETLKKYLDSINRYFSSFEDSTEIMADIEGRIAEILLSKLNEGKQVITLEDVNALIATMGSVRDFQAAEEREMPEEGTPGAGSSQSRSSGTTYEYVPPKQLLRDQKRKILGGVCAGLGTYFNVDPVWFRLLFALLTFAYGIPVLIYIIMWIVMPGSYDLEEPVVRKKMFRDPERKVLAGVSGGVAAFTGVDIIAVRLLFIILTFVGGLGLAIYIVLWIALPEAQTITDRVQMGGEPVTLSNIESTLKKNLNETGREESALTKIILFPFRVIALLIEALGKILVPLLDVLRVAIGVIITLTGLGLLVAAIFTGAALLGLFTLPSGWTADHNSMGIPLEAFRNVVPTWTAVSVFVAAIIPCIFILLLGTSVSAKRVTFNAATGWFLFALFFISVVIAAISIPKIVYGFKENGEYRTEQTFDMNGRTALLKINEVGLDDYDGAHLTLRGYSGNVLKLEQTFEAQGSTRIDAIDNARMVTYDVSMQDSVITFDSNIRFKENVSFRAQELDMILYIPFDYPFVMEERFSRFITNYVDHRYLHGYTWAITRHGLECLNCPKEVSAKEDAGLTDFTKVDLSGKFDVRIRKGDEYAVEFTGNESERKRYSVYRSGNTLVIEYDGNRSFDWETSNLKVEEIRINIVMPELEEIDATGLGNIHFDKFIVDDFKMKITGPVNVTGGLQADYLDLDLAGKTNVTLSGQTGNLTADVKFASRLDAYNLTAEDADIEVTGASVATITVTGTLDIDESLGSKVSYRGSPDEVRRN